MFNIESYNRQFQKRYDDLFKEGISAIEIMAREALAEYPEFHEFIMAGGNVQFTRYNDEISVGFYDDDEIEQYPLIKQLYDFIGEWDHYLHFTGWPMRFTANGNVVRNW